MISYCINSHEQSKKWFRVQKRKTSQHLISFQTNSCVILFFYCYLKSFQCFFNDENWCWRQWRRKIKFKIFFSKDEKLFSNLKNIIFKFLKFYEKSSVNPWIFFQLHYARFDWLMTSSHWTLTMRSFTHHRVRVKKWITFMWNGCNDEFSFLSILFQFNKFFYFSSSILKAFRCVPYLPLTSHITLNIWNVCIWNSSLFLESQLTT